MPTTMESHGMTEYPPTDRQGRLLRLQLLLGADGLQRPALTGAGRGQAAGVRGRQVGLNIIVAYGQ